MRERNGNLNESGIKNGANERAADLVSDPHVRHLIQYLSTRERPVSLPTIATHVAARITNRSPDEIPDKVKKRVQTFLHHGHLPELARHGIVEFDRESNTVRLVG